MKHRFQLFLILLPWGLAAQPLDSLVFARLNESILQLQASELMRQGILGVSLRDRESGETLLQLNEEKALPPASTIKLATTAAALEILGEDFSFSTHLEYEGTISKGVLKGNLYLRGTGDPTLGSPRFKDRTDSATVFNNWITALRAAGIRRIDGNVYADDQHFDLPGVADTWLWGDVANGYGAGVYGLNWNENITRLYFKPGVRTGTPADLVRVEPTINGVTYLNRVKTGPPGSGDRAVIRPYDYRGRYLVDGTIPRVRGEFSIRGAITNPALLIAEYFKSFLHTNELPVSGQAAVWLPSKNPSSQRRHLHTYQSPSLVEICKEINWWSVNIYADAVFKAMSYKLAGTTDFATASGTLTSFWATKGLSVTGIALKDGSGLSGAALITPRTLSALLNTATHFRTFPLFYGTLPVAGKDGTVRSSRFGSRTTIRAKSGSIGGTRTFAGYITTSSGRRLTFVVNANRYLADSSTQVARELIAIVRLMGEL